MRTVLFPIGVALMSTLFLLDSDAPRGVEQCESRPAITPAPIDTPDAALQARFRDALCGSGFDLEALVRIQCQFDASGAYRPDYALICGAEPDETQRAELDRLADSFDEAIRAQAEIAMSELLIAIEHEIDGGGLRIARQGPELTHEEFLAGAPSAGSRELFSTSVAIEGWLAVLELRAHSAPAFAHALRELEHMRRVRDTALRRHAAHSNEHVVGASPSTATPFDTTDPLQ